MSIDDFVFIINCEKSFGKKKGTFHIFRTDYKEEFKKPTKAVKFF
jgi:hypothetical protein